MKRQSKAEEALAKQVKRIDAEIEKLQFGVNTMQDRISGMKYVREQLEVEIDQLKHARLKASTDRKP